MLSEMLHLLDGGVSRSQDELAALTGVSREAVEAGIDYLYRAGYLRPVSLQADCSGHCKGCPGCRAAEPGRPIAWERVR